MPLTDDDAVDAVLSSRAAPTRTVTPDVSPDDAAVDSVLEDRKSQAKQNVTAATRMTPDQAAGVHKLAREAGLSSWAVEGNEAWMLQQVTARKNFDLLDKNPILARALANNPAFADTAFDDLANADKIAKAFEAGGFPAASPVARRIADKQQKILDEGGTGRISATPTTLWDDVKPSAIALARGAANLPGTVVGFGGAVMDVLDPFGKSELTSMAQQWGNSIDTLLPPVQAKGVLPEGWFSGLESLGANAPVVIGSLLAAGPVAGPPLALALMSASSGGHSAREAQKAGADAWKTLGLTTTDAVAEYVTEKIGIKYLMDVPGLKNAFLKTAAKFAGAEMAGEQVATVWQDFNKWMLLNPEKTVAEFGDERLHAAAVTAVATIVGGGGQIALMKGLSEVAKIPQQRAAADAQRVADLFATASESLALKRDPVAFKEFFQTVAPDTSVYIAPAKLSEVMAESKLDLATVLPSAAEQIAAGEIAGPGIEVPIGELITGLTGTGAEAAIIQHIRTSPDAMTLAESQADSTKTAEFFQKESERVLAKQADNEAFGAEAKAVQNDILTQLNQAQSYRPQVNDAFATLAGHAMTVLADRLGTTPMQVWQEHHLNIHGAKGPQANTLNIGLDIGATDRAQQVPVEDVIKAIEKFGVKVAKRSPISATYQHEGKDVTENTLVVDTSRPLTDAEMLQLANDLGQEAIPQRTGQTGKLYGPKAAEWGDFNPEFFKEHDGRAMSEVFDQQLSAAAFDSQDDLFAKDFAGKNTTFIKTVVVSSKGATEEIALPNMDSTGRQLTRTKQGLERFWAWYGDGPVDSEHRPLVMYHSTKADSDVLKPGMPTKNNFGFLGDVDITRAAIFATPEREFSQEYLRSGAGQNVMPVFVAAQNPFDSRDGISIDQEERLVAEGISSRWLYDFRGADWEMYDNDDDGKNVFVDALKRLGYDGAVFNEEGQDGKSHTTYAVFESTQIKSAIGNRGTFDPNDPNILHQSQSTRRPSTKKNPENHLGEVPLSVDYMKIEPEKTEQNMKLVSQYPGIRFKARKAEGRAEEFIQHVTSNLLWLHDLIPAEIRQRSKLWYDGARAITDRWSAKYGKTDAQIAAILAVYSPQKDWFMNVSLAERTLDIVANQQDTAWSPEMTEVADKILADEKFSMLRGAIEGKKLSELKDRLEQAVWLRTFDEAHNNRGHRLVTPEGGFIELATSVKGAEKKTGWPGFGTIIKALYVIDDGSPKMIDNALGGEHKVRSFYNNIFHPTSDLGFVTIDTHAVAAGLLRPLSGNSVEVTHNFGGEGTATSAATGMSGTYAYYQEAYRRAAEARGLLPREMQSITWEAVRELYTRGFKHDKDKLNALDAIWTEFEKGKRSIDTVRAEILRLAGGVEQPAWAGRNSGLHEKGWASSYTGDLLGPQLPGRNTGAVDAGAGERAARLYQTQRAAGAVAGPVVGVHFSKEKRTTLLGSAFGTGAKGAERERLAVATDPRIKQRVAFYVDTGKGIHPEDDVGAVAHTAELTNLYDANADALKIFKDAKGDMNAAESAVLDAGYAGYLTREFGQQGAVVMLGPQSINVEHVGGLKDVKVPQPPAANIPAMKTLALSIIQNRSLPAGQMSRDEWQKTLAKTNPTLAEQIDFSKLEEGKGYYKDDIAGLLWQGGHWYFSQLQAAVEKAPAKVFASGNAVKQWLVSNAGKLGVKQAEIEATGVTDWLDTQGKSPVDRAMVVEFLKGNGVRVTETMLASNDVVIDTEIEDGADIRGYHVTQEDSGKWNIYDINSQELQKTTGSRWGAADWINENTEGIETPKFENYKLPGGENYRELLLTLPTVDVEKLYRPRVVEVAQTDAPPRFDLLAEDGAVIDTFSTWSEAMSESYRIWQDAQIAAVKENPRFMSSHWSQPNVLAHMRVDTVQGANDEKLLRVIEIQSDWGQKGKKEGFDKDTRKTKPLEPGEYKAFIARMRKAAGDVFRQRGGEQVDDAMVESLTKTLPLADLAQTAGMEDEYLSITERQNEDWNRREGHNAVVPAAPFVTDTKSWTALVIKRALMLAAQEGYDGVVFATGQQNADIYDLSKQLDTVLWDGDEKTGTLIARKDGSNVLVEKGIDSVKLADYIGKDAAEKLLAAEKNQYGMREVSGLDLKVGDEGMRTFYDEIVPSVAKSVLKQIGAGETAIEKIKLPGRSKLANWYDGIDHATNATQQPGFLISEDLRNQLLTTGVPLFARGTAGDRLGSFRPATLDMQLLANANLTTFMHELGHFFLTVYTDVASQPGAPKGVADDVNALLRWFGVPDLATWNSMTTEQQTPYHEKFAESFEQYLFSGKAPNVELKTLFAKFASWMKKVYGSLKEFLAGHPGAQLNPEVEAVMERMLATEQEIADANEQRNYEALFKTAVDAGMTDREFAEYMALTDAQREDAEALLRSRSLRDMKWLRSARDKVIAELQKDSRDQRVAMLAKVKAELAATPIRKAMRWLKQGEMIDANGNDVKATEGYKLQLSDLDEVFPPGMLNRPDLTKLGVGKYGMVAKAGLHPDMVAEMFGFSSGEALARDLIAQPSFSDEAEALTDQRMLEEYGDLSSPEAIARAADEAVHNTARARMVATELAAVAENVGSPASLMKAAKEYARQLIATKTSKTLKPWAFAAAEMRAGKAALTALRKGDTAVVAKEKRTELVNHAAVKEAYAAEAEIKAIVARFKKIMGYSDKHSAITSRDMATVQAVRAVLAQVGVAEHKGGAAAEYLDLVDQYDPVTGQTLRETIKDSGEAKDWHDIKLADLRVLAENIDNIWGRAKSLREFVIGEKRMTQDEVVAEIMPVLTPHLPGEKLGAKNAVTEKEQRLLSYSGLKSVFARIEIWANKIDNAKVIGPLTRYVVNTIKAAEGRYLAQRSTELALLNARVASIAHLLKPRLIEAPELGYTFGKGASRSGLAELIGALQHIGNASNKQKMLIGGRPNNPWATVRQDGSLDTTKWDNFIKRIHDEGILTKEVYDFVQGNWDMFERIKPDMQRSHKAVFGKFFGEITAEKVVTPFGTYAGGYVPALTDRDIVHDLDVKELDLETLGGVSHSLPAPAAGMTKERSNSYNKPLAFDLTLLPMQLNKALLFAHMAPPVQQVQRLVSNTALTDALDQAFPGARKHMIMPWLARAATHRTSLQATEFGDTGNWWKRLRSNTGMARMMGNISNTIQQYTGALTAAGVLEKPRHLMYAAPALLGIGNLRAQVKEMSPHMATRMDNELSSISANIHEILVNPSAYEKVDNWTRRNAYFMQQWADVHLSPVVWMAAYNSAKDAHPDIAEQEARDYADSVIRRTQGATGATDISTFESGSPFAQMFTQFFSWSLIQGQTIWGELAKNADSQRSPLAKVGRASGIILSMVLAQAIVAEAIALAFRGGPDDDDGDGQLIDDWLHQVLIMGPVKFMVGMVPVAGKAITVVINKTNDNPYDDRISAAPVFSAIENAAGSPMSVYKAIMEDGKPSKAIKDVSELATLFGIPAAPLARPIGYAADVVSGHVEPTSGADFMRGIMTGTASPESKR